MNKEHLSAEQYVIRTLNTLSIQRINDLAASWILVYLFRESMNCPHNQYGACTWTKPDNWNIYVQHFREKFNNENIQCPWGQNGYINADDQNYFYSLGDNEFCIPLDIYIDTLKDWYKFTVYNDIGGISFGVFPLNI